MTWVADIWNEAFPFRSLGSPQGFAATTLGKADALANVQTLRDAIAAQADENRLREFCDIALKRLDDETARQNSIMARAQALFVALAFFGLLFTFGVGLFGQTVHVDPWLLRICLGFVVYILLQIVVMVINILSAIRGIAYKTPGSSDLARWVSVPLLANMYRARAVMAVEYYREAVLYNNWRFEHLEDALKGLRNIVWALSVLIFFFFAAGVLLPSASAPSPVFQQPETLWHWHRFHRFFR